MHIKNTDDRFGWISIILHWIMAVLLIGLLMLGLYMVGLAFSHLKLKLYGWHKEFGLLALALVIFRVIWRLSNRTPSLAALPALERFAARAMHFAFYCFMFLIPISGWCLTSAAGLPASFFGLFVLPTLVSASEAQRLFFTEIHKLLSYGLILAILGHVAAALKHHFINKDDILRRMLWP
jgi:cytochrome b561